MNSGRVKAGEAVLIGPDMNGNYQSTVIKSMQRKRAAVSTAEAGQCVSLALKRIKRAAVRKGMVIVNKSDTAPKGLLPWTSLAFVFDFCISAVRKFEGQVLIL
jgi:GTPase